MSERLPASTLEWVLDLLADAVLAYIAVACLLFLFVAYDSVRPSRLRRRWKGAPLQLLYWDIVTWPVWMPGVMLKVLKREQPPDPPE